MATATAELVPGMSPKEVADAYFRALVNKDASAWVSTLSRQLRGSCKDGGPFSANGWVEGSAKVRKYDAHWYYSPLHTGERSSALGPDGQVAEYLTLKYDAVYGDVPGLVKDEPMGSADAAISARGPGGNAAHGESLVPITLVKESGEGGEWRVHKADI